MSTVLKHINRTIEPGQSVGFLGATGSGKSSLVSLVPRFYDVLSGRVTIDGVDVRDIPQDNLRRNVGICLQEANLFSGTIRETIKFGRPDATDDEMIATAEAADADSFVQAIPEKYDGRVARRGSNFSGGQRQCLSIAGALAQNPRILILDDMSSACLQGRWSAFGSTSGHFGSGGPDLALWLYFLSHAGRHGPGRPFSTAHRSLRSITISS